MTKEEFKQVLDDLGCLEAYEYNFKRQAEDQEECYFDVIGDFIWADTNEGYKFWSSIRDIYLHMVDFQSNNYSKPYGKKYPFKQLAFREDR